MKKKLPWGIVGGYTGMLLGFVGGGVFGKNYFGNQFPYIKFMGYRGGEAGLWIGSIAGIIIGITLGVIFALLIVGRAE
jgi:hypothetical protein